MKTAVYYAGKLLVKLLFGCVARIHVIGRLNANRASGFLLASNHISHFDPFLISLFGATKDRLDDHGRILSAACARFCTALN